MLFVSECCIPSFLLGCPICLDRRVLDANCPCSRPPARGPPPYVVRNCSNPSLALAPHLSTLQPATGTPTLSPCSSKAVCERKRERERECVCVCECGCIRMYVYIYLYGFYMYANNCITFCSLLWLLLLLPNCFVCARPYIRLCIPKGHV